MQQHTMPLTKMLRGQGMGAKSVAIRNKLIRKIVVLLVLITCVALFCVWSRVKIIQMGYEFSALQKKSGELTKKVNHLKLEVEKLRSPGRLQKVAVNALGMYPPKSDQVVFLKKEGSELVVKGEAQQLPVGNSENKIEEKE